jgi:diaminopimelate dehydrogenase
VDAVRRGEQPELSARDKHLRECWVVAAEDADRERIEREIKTMPYYFDQYDTTVNFITAEELARDHAGLPHGGSVLRGGVTGWEKEHRQTIEFSLKLDSNPEFTGSVLAACARAVHRMAREGMTGCKTILDIPPAWLSPVPAEELRAHFL